VELADVAEVDLRDVAGDGLDGDQDVVGRDRARLLPPSPHAAHRVEAAREAGLVELETVEDRVRREPGLGELDDLGSQSATDDVICVGSAVASRRSMAARNTSSSGSSSTGPTSNPSSASALR
jgi:hypothetical protein